MKCPAPRRVCFSGDTDTTCSTTLSMPPSNTGVRYSASLDAFDDRGAGERNPDRDLTP